MLTKSPAGEKEKNTRYKKWQLSILILPANIMKETVGDISKKSVQKMRPSMHKRCLFPRKK